MLEGQEADVRRRPALVGRPPRQPLVPGAEDVQGEIILAGRHVGEFHRHHLAGVQVDDIHPPLGVLAHLVVVALRPALGGVEGHHPGVVVVGAVHRPGAQAEDQAHHAGGGVDELVPGVGILRQTHPGDLGEEVTAIAPAGDALHQQGHLLVPVEEATLLAIAQGLLAQGAGVDGLDGGQEVIEALLVGALVGAEDALVLAGEGIAVAVLQQGAGADDDGRLAEVVQHLDELLHKLGGETPGDDAPAGLVEVIEQGVLTSDLTLAV